MLDVIAKKDRGYIDWITALPGENQELPSFS